MHFTDGETEASRLRKLAQGHTTSITESLMQKSMVLTTITNPMNKKARKCHRDPKVKG